jgi:hypothetical protein
MTLFVLLVVTSVRVLGQAATSEAGSCAAFAADGTSAAATYDDKTLSLEITDPAGKPRHLSSATLRPLNPYYVPDRESAPETCRIFFDGMGDWVALGISARPVAGASLEVVVADVKSAAWVGHFVVQPQISVDTPALWGFLRGTKSLVITRQVGNGTNTEKGLLYGSFLFASTGAKLSEAPLNTWRIPGRTAWNSFYADAAHSRLWIPCGLYAPRLSGQPFCAISARSLITEDDRDSTVFNPSGRSFEKLEAWMRPGAAAFPDSNTILMAETVFRVDTVWRVNMREQTMQRLVIPHYTHFPSSDWSEAASLSPDGQIVGVSFDQNTGDFPWGLVESAHWSGKHIAIVGVQPLRTITIFPSGRAQRISAFAVDHRLGKIVLLAFHDGRWQRHEFGDQARPN